MTQFGCSSRQVKKHRHHTSSMLVDGGRKKTRQMSKHRSELHKRGKVLLLLELCSHLNHLSPNQQSRIAATRRGQPAHSATGWLIRAKALIQLQKRVSGGRQSGKGGAQKAVAHTAHCCRLAVLEHSSIRRTSPHSQDLPPVVVASPPRPQQAGCSLGVGLPLSALHSHSATTILPNSRLE
ncbi:hypothetical protein DdX_02111 [Ditylenchus destructor]|uniref:Uncharacterized protein n=1 Tax=Ditylenchus destructor TaxID=166010 RepID=A0AAD4NBX0_9BILA|nr:hypothetical protein DdX_02111 [Ditylenchus destructor]